MKRLVLAAACLAVASASFAQSADTLADTYRKALENARLEAARQQKENHFDAALSAAGFLPADPHNHDEDDPVVSLFWTPLGQTREYGPAAFGVLRTQNDVVTVYLNGHPVIGSEQLAYYATSADFEKKTGGAAAVKAFAESLRESYPYVPAEIPAWVQPQTADLMRRNDALARARAADVAALCKDLSALGMAISSDASGEKTDAVAGRVTVSIETYYAGGVDIAVSVSKKPIPKGPLASYDSIASFRAKTGELAQIKELIAAAKN